MEKLSSIIVKYRKTIIILFGILVLISIILQGFVSVNYNMVDYLPPNAQSTKAIQIMEDEFTQAMPNARVMIKNVSLAQALSYKEELTAISGVTQVLWLDDVVDVKKPLEIADSKQVEGFYKNQNALYTVTIEEGMEKEACGAILDLIGEENSLAGDAPDLIAAQSSAEEEVVKAMIILLPIIIIILILSTTSWLEPILFMVAIGISIIINMGTNYFLGEISFITNAVTPILQMACSLDYAIFLIHSFSANRKKYDDVTIAMKHSIKESMITVAASAATTLFGFLALVFMNFRIGADLGINLAKGIVLSFLSVMIFLPALTLLLYKFVDRTKHKEFLPGFQSLYKMISKVFIPIIALVVILIVPSFLGQGKVEFLYGNSSNNSATRSGRDSAAIAEEFEQSTLLAILVPKGSPAKERALCDALSDLDHVTGVTSYVSSVGTAIPVNFLAKEIQNQFYSEHYTRIILYTDTLAEGEVAFETVDHISAIAKSFYGDSVYMAGQSANTNDMKNVISRDTKVVNFVAILSIFLVLLVAFRSAILPFLLLLSIEAGIWINLSIPYFSGITISFMGYLIISSVQLGATVDYAILLTNNYLQERKQNDKRTSVRNAWLKSVEPILVSGSILATAGFTLYATSTNPVIFEMGILVGRGALFSMGMVLLFLPALLLLFDRIIEKTTYKSEFSDKS
ncbi:MAG: transporter [Herbinix sp.]|nr:transporter [Herbinix sp.]